MAIKDFKNWGFVIQPGVYQEFLANDDPPSANFDPDARDGDGAFVDAQIWWLRSQLGYLDDATGWSYTNNGFSGNCFGLCVGSCSGCYSADIDMPAYLLDSLGAGFALVPGSLRIATSANSGNWVDDGAGGWQPSSDMVFPSAHNASGAVNYATTQISFADNDGYYYQFQPNTAEISANILHSKFSGGAAIPAIDNYVGGFNINWARSIAPLGINNVYLDYEIIGSDGNAYVDTITLEDSEELMAGSFTAPSLPSGVTAKSVKFFVGAGFCEPETGIQVWFEEGGSGPPDPDGSALGGPIVSVGLASTIEELLRD